jgi:hypothetical protein
MGDLMEIVFIVGALLWADQYFSPVNPEAEKYYERRQQLKEDKVLENFEFDAELVKRLKAEGKTIKRAPAKKK